MGAGCELPGKAHTEPCDSLTAGVVVRASASSGSGTDCPNVGAAIDRDNSGTVVVHGAELASSTEKGASNVAGGRFATASPECTTAAKGA